MQVNSILNLLLPSAAGGQASPLNLLAGQEGANGLFTGLLGDQVGQVEGEGFDATSLLESLNPESGGIVPVPLVSDTAQPLLQGASQEALTALQAKLQYISQREGRVPSEVIAGVVKGAEAQAALQASQSVGVENVGKALPNELANDEDFQLGVQQLVYSGKGKETGVELALNSAKQNADKAPIEILNQLKEKFAAQAPAPAQPTAANVEDSENYIIVKDIVNGGQEKPADAKVTSLLASLNTKAGVESTVTTGFNVEAIDANEEILSNQKFRGMGESKLEMHAKLLEQQTQNPQFRSPADQVTVKITQAVAEGMDKIRIKLHPAELGRVSVEMDVADDGKTQVKIIADKSDTLELLRRDHADLARALREVGMKTDANGLEFSLRGEGGKEFGGMGDGSKHRSHGGSEDEAASADFSQIDEYIKYGSLNEQELVLNISQQGLNIVA